MNLIEPLIAELRQEAKTTKRMLERLPESSLNWQPHEKSMTLGRLATHIAALPDLFIAKLDGDEFDRSGWNPPAAEGASDIVAMFDENISRSIEFLKTQSEERLLGPWRYRSGEQVIFEMPRLAVIRFVCLNHLIHHRGQLSVYFRLLNVPLPPAYGPTADESLA